MSIENENEWEEIDLSEIEDAGISDEFQQAAIKAEVAHSEAEQIASDRANLSTSDAAFMEESLIKRTKILRAEQGFDFPHMKPVGEGMEAPNPRSDANRMAFFNAIFDNGSGRCPYPFFDTFKSQALDHLGQPIDDLNSHAEELCRAMDMVGLKNQSFTSIDDAYRRFALKFKRNSLIERMNRMIPEWDGTARVDSFLIKLFRLRDTNLNRIVGRYFWFSLFNRVMTPGCQAPIAITLIGDQNTGKSYFFTILCRLILGNNEVETVPVDLTSIERNANEWLRKITGNSVIANLGEMRGYNRVDIDAIKDFATRTSDTVHRKFENERRVSRQWILACDANRYEGFHRDETGNRRFFPFFVNQIDDVDGQPAWEVGTGWSADFASVRENFWQIMAEVSEHMTRGGMDYYDNLVLEATRAVAEFSRQEMSMGRGIIKDEATETALRSILLGANMAEFEGAKNKGVVVANAEIQKRWNKQEKGSINYNAVRRVLTAMGFEYTTVKGFGRCYILRDVMDVRIAKRYIWMNADISELESIRKNPAKYKADSSGDSSFLAALAEELKNDSDSF